MNPKHIIDGWYNLLFKSEKVEALAKERAAICFDCPHKKYTKISVFLKSDFYDIDEYICELCNCPLSAKVRSLESKCEDSRW